MSEDIKLKYLSESIEMCKARLNLEELRFCNPLNCAATYKMFVDYYIVQHDADVEWSQAKVIQESGQLMEESIKQQMLARVKELKRTYDGEVNKLKKLNKGKSLRMPDLPEYSAELYPDPADYLDKIECVMRGKGVSKSDFHKGLLVGANNEVSTWYKSVDKSERKNWKSLSKLFVDRFSSAYVQQDRQRRLEVFVPELGSKLSTNFMRLEHCAERAKLSLDKQGMNIMAVRVNSMLTATERNVLRSATSECNNYKEYLDMAAKHLEDRKVTIEKMSCTVCDKGGHTMFACPTMGNYGREESNRTRMTKLISSVMLKSGKRNHDNANEINVPSENGSITCFKCGNSGHIARDCTQLKNDIKLRLNQIVDQCLEDGALGDADGDLSY